MMEWYSKFDWFDATSRNKTVQEGPEISRTATQTAADL